jgi:hypothetical protein
MDKKARVQLIVYHPVTDMEDGRAVILGEDLHTAICRAIVWGNRIGQDFHVVEGPEEERAVVLRLYWSGRVSGPAPIGPQPELTYNAIAAQVRRKLEENGWT